MDFAQARYYSSRLGRFTSTDPSRISIKFDNPQTWNRYTYCLNNPLKYIDDNGKWPITTHRKIIQTAFNNIRTSAIERGSEKVDGGITNPKTMYEKNAPQHAMTPGSKVKELGSIEKAQNWARGEAKAFIKNNLDEAKEALKAKSVWADKDKMGDKALEKFGAAMHPVMDNVSPEHTGFQVFTYKYQGGMIGASDLVKDGIDNINHSVREGGLWGDRQPTDAEMNLMVDEMRLAYQQTFGQKAYEQAVTEPERKLTEDRLAGRGSVGMLIK